ncbi:hypothetical protein TNCV_2950261 [Trichonephila clavipes]|nr:hypothetical protein TNCV_2950261 [Trichonephila clavipes]
MGKAGRRARVLVSETCQAKINVARWIVRRRVSGQVDRVPLEIVGSSAHEEVPTRGKPGLERPGRPRGERELKDRSESTCGPHSDSFNNTSRLRRSNCFTNNFQTPCRSKS